MVKRKKTKRYTGMTYRQLQASNKKKKSLLNWEDKVYLKDNNYINKGWQNVISLYEKIKEIRRKNEICEMSLEELFLESDRIGNKYQTDEERKEFQKVFQKVLEEISVESDKYFPNDEYEYIDFSKEFN